MDSTDLCPTEDAIGTLLEYLVDPILPSKSSARSIPSQSDEELVAKQVHAVVLLYNYYYRKLHPYLEFLGLENFCKLAIIIRPSLLPYMKFMQQSNDTELDDLEKQLSLTEKMIMDACDLSANLDASQNTPSTEGWPICKVSVFLIDSRKENCSLKFGFVTERVWSVIEKDVDLSNNNSKSTMDSEHVDKKKRFIRKPLRNSGTDEAEVQQIAFSAVKETTGINQSELLVLDHRVVYSITKEKAAACFFIMQCTQPKDDHVIQNPIEDTINSLQGPLFVRSSSRWIHTSVVEYFHLLPYAGILLDWASRDGLSNSLHFQRVGSDKRIETQVPRSSCRQHLGSRKETGLTKQNEDNECYVIDLSDGVDGLHNMEVDDSSVIHTKTTDKDTDISSKIQTDNCKKHTTFVDGCLNGLEDKAKTADLLKRQRITGNGNLVTTNKDYNGISLDNDQIPVSDHAPILCHPNFDDLDKVRTIIASKGQQLSQAALRVILSKRAKLCLQLRDIEDQIVQCDKNIQTILNGGEGDLGLKIEYLIEGCNDVPLRSFIEETTYQDNKDQCLTQRIRSKRSAVNISDMQNPCQELDDLCCRNNWILPTYCLCARDGGFHANLIVKGMDFEYSSGGDVCPQPREARESAATQMLAKLCNVPNIVW